MVRFYRSQYPQENIVIEALYHGCPEEKELTNLDDYQPSDAAVVMGVYKKKVPASYARGRIIDAQRDAGNRTIVLETGYINRGDGNANYYALGWNGLNGRADFRNSASPPDRARKLDVSLEPRHYGQSVLLCGQVPWDASCDFIDMWEWLCQTAKDIRAKTGRPIIFRPHPKGNLPTIPGCQYSVGKALSCDLERSYCAVSFNSNTGVDALIAGLPVFAFDVGSMVYNVANHNISDIDNPWFPNREQWLNDIAYAQWTPDEMRSGEAWDHLLK